MIDISHDRKKKVQPTSLTFFHVHFVNFVYISAVRRVNNIIAEDEYTGMYLTAPPASATLFLNYRFTSTWDFNSSLFFFNRGQHFIFPPDFRKQKAINSYGTLFQIFIFGAFAAICARYEL